MGNQNVRESGTDEAVSQIRDHKKVNNLFSTHIKYRDQEGN